MARKIVDFSRVPEHQLEIHQRLGRWAQWVRPSYQKWMVQPMFRGYRSHAWQWEMPEIKPEVSSLEALETEKIVSSLPEKMRTAIRWCYVFNDSPTRMCRKLNVDMDGLEELVTYGRDVVNDRLHKTLA